MRWNQIFSLLICWCRIFYTAGNPSLECPANWFSSSTKFTGETYSPFPSQSFLPLNESFPLSMNPFPLSLNPFPLSMNPFSLLMNHFSSQWILFTSPLYLLLRFLFLFSTLILQDLFSPVSSLVLPLPHVSFLFLPSLPFSPYPFPLFPYYA